MDENFKNLNQALLAAMDAYTDQACFQSRQGGRYQGFTYQRFRTLTLRLTHYFLDQGISNGERVVLAADNCLEWMVTYTACLLSGGVIVPLYTSLANDTLRFTLRDSGARLAILQEERHLHTVLADLASDTETALPDLKIVLTLNYQGVPLTKTTPLNTILLEAMPLSAAKETAIRTHAENIAPEALAAIYYVPDKTGKTRGAVFDHARCVTNIRHMVEWFTFDQDDVAFTRRPWSEVPSLMASVHYFLSGIPNALVESQETIAENMQQASPTVMLDIPYHWERLYEGFMSWIADQPEGSQDVFRWAIAKGKEYWAAGPNASPELKQEYDRADMTFFNQFRGYIGGRISRLYSTGASLSRELAEFFEAIGLPMLNLYSLTEAGGFPAISRLEARRAGAVGRVAPGFELRIGPDNEILIRSETLMREYWRCPEETSEAFDVDGWLRTDDVGYIDEDGYLYITGRRQHLIVLSTGRKIAPTLIENALTASPFISQAAVFGEGKPYVSAMILPDLEALVGHFKTEDHSADEPVLTTVHPKVKELLDKVIGEVNSQLDSWEEIKEYSLLDQALSKDAGELTASMKISRHVVAERYASQIQSMYPLKVHLEEREVTEVQIDPERLRELLEKESILDAWMADAGIEFLFDLARSKQIDAPSMVHICDTAAMIAQMESEEKPLSTALIVGDPGRIARILPPGQIQLIRDDHIRRMRKNLVTLSKMVDGVVLGYVVDKHGYVRGIRRLKIPEHHFSIKRPLDVPSNVLLGPLFRHHAAISQLCNAVVFFVPAGGRQVRVFAHGQLVGRYSNGDWSPESISRVPQMVADVAQEKGYDVNLIQRVLRCAFQMSEANLGAIFVIGDADKVLEHSDSSEISHFALIVSANIDHLTDQELINFAKQDGATVIDIQGKFRGCMVLLRPDAETQAEIGSGKGARHSSAAKMSAEAQCLAITVSQDGPITMYDSGRRILSL